MISRLHVKTLGTTAACVMFIIAGVIFSSSYGRADDSKHEDESESRIRRGFDIAPVPLNLDNKNRALVGLGSYLVNAVGGCNDCHTNPPYTKNPYNIGVTAKEVNRAGYLAGGTTFGPFTSRNLTPDKSGKPVGGASFSDFLQIIRTGIDMDQWHLNLPPPTNGKLLQVMPWPVYQDMTDSDLRAVYEYLRSIPCVEGDPGNPKGSDTHGHRCK